VLYTVSMTGNQRRGEKTIMLEQRRWGKKGRGGHQWSSGAWGQAKKSRRTIHPGRRAEKTLGKPSLDESPCRKPEETMTQSKKDKKADVLERRQGGNPLRGRCTPVEKDPLEGRCKDGLARDQGGGGRCKARARAVRMAKHGAKGKKRERVVFKTTRQGLRAALIQPGTGS